GPDGFLYVSLNKGFFAWSDKDSSALSYGGTPVYATRIMNFNGQVLVATFNRGIFLANKGVLRPVTLPQTGQPNAAPDLRAVGDRVWVLYDKTVLELSPDFRVREISDLPFLGSEVTDISDEGDSVLVASARGLFRVPKNQNGTTRTRTLIDFVRINDSLDGGPERHLFSHRENTLAINLSTPWFSSSDHLRYRYRLCGGDTGCNWLLAEEDQTSFSFINLPPGTYTFSAVAVTAIGTPLAPEVTYTFRIAPPWYQTWWARLLGLLALTGLFFSLGLYLQRRRSRRQRARYEKMLAVEHERQRISAEIHDDLGATLSGVRLLTELAREKIAPGPLRHDLEKIHQSITSLTEKTREVIWTLNTEQDSVESLLLYVQKSAQHLFEAAPIRLQVQLPVEVPPLRIPGDVRRHVYLAVKEALHNCLKHSGATWCRLEMTCARHLLHIAVHDNGTGIERTPATAPRPFSSGMRTMQQRMVQAGGSLRLHSNESGTRVLFIIPLPKNNG
ncbi:MAG: hypothetical protein EOO11_19875, partial [Chitinophagaceae bacterium]